MEYAESSFNSFRQAMGAGDAEQELLAAGTPHPVESHVTVSEPEPESFDLPMFALLQNR